MAKGNQIAAARALLSWEQSDLAHRAGVSQGTISNIEKGNGTQTGTMSKIERVFAQHGVTFTDTAINFQEPEITTFDNFNDVLDDIASVTKRGSAVCFHCADDTRSSEEVTSRMQAFEKSGLKLRFTYRAGNSYFTTSPENYRWIPEDYFASSQVQVIYADRVILHIENTDGDKFIMIRNQVNADAMRKQFDYWWRSGQPCA